MDDMDLQGLLAFIKRAENLKNTLRSSCTSQGRPESAAEHSWRLCLLAVVLGRSFPEMNREKVLLLAVIHDLAEAVCGDVPAVRQDEHARKAALEESALTDICAPLPPALRRDILDLWREYEAGSSPEARYVKALDKLETLIQHTQGRNPPDFDYAFNLGYGRELTDSHPLLARLRRVVDRDTARRLVSRDG